MPTPSYACEQSGGVWNPSTSTCHLETLTQQQVDAACQSTGKVYDPVTQTCVSQDQAQAKQSWWSGLSSAEKYGIIGAGALAVGLGAYFMLKPHKAKPNASARNYQVQMAWGRRWTSLSAFSSLSAARTAAIRVHREDGAGMRVIDKKTGALYLIIAKTSGSRSR